jgi:hypothetical protein
MVVNMVEILNGIIEREARMEMVPKYAPQIIGYGETPRIVYDGLVIPRSLNKEFLKKCGIEGNIPDNDIIRDNITEKIVKANAQKDLYVRYADEKPLSVVTGRFREIKPSDVMAEIADVLQVAPTIRYFRGNESLQLNFPLDNRFHGLYINVNTGSYGIYGGSGKQAVSYGISWYNTTCSNWTVFLRKSLNEISKENGGRIIHIDDINPKKTIEQLASAANYVEEAIESSHDKIFKPEQLGMYFNIYESKGMTKNISETIKAENPKGASAYDISYRLTQLCQNPKLADVTRGRIEYMAGEMILSYKDIIRAADFRLENPGLFNPLRQN